ncbi:MAG: type II toxin-antitoxin system prevent-host-death family antitoxin, partial [Pseudomonadota bacterium]|nr:type II toxin-antitoxin system prevent-host-death family antitoxin [Pseudomonadota bacterium]
MREFPSTDIARNSKGLLALAGRGPVAITRNNRTRYVLMRIEKYERLQERVVYSLRKKR